ncbi:MAG: Ig-like domain-containing protein, partial [Patescibacteria group bacterium]
MKQTQKNFFQGVFTALILVGGFLILGYEILAPSNALALSISNQFAQQMGYSTIPLDQQIVTIIQWALGFLALIAVIMIIYGGILWLTAAGNADRVERAKKVIMAAIIGIVILLLAWAIVWFVIQGVTEGGSGGPPGGQALQCVGNQCVMVAGGSGNCIDNSDCSDPGGAGSYITVTMRSPHDNETDVSLCRSVQVKFSEAVVENNSNITLDKVAGGSVAGAISYAGNDIYMKFQPTADLEPNTDYVANIPLSVVAQDGDPIDQQYTWQFKTGTTMDELPPQILQTSPADGATDVCLTPTFVVAFSEAMDVFTFKPENITINGPGNLTATRVDAMSDTVMTFTASGPMTANSNYTITLKSGPDGITDACGNPIDGNGNGAMDGTPADDYSWDFTTGSQADCKPEITNINPAFGLYEQAVTINGNNFTDIANTVVFNNNDEVDNRCFDPNFYATNACIQSWNNTQIVVQVPAGGGNSNGAIDGGVKVLVGPQESNEKDFDVQSPHIRTMSPDDGADGRFVTLMGTDFGAAPGRVWFRKMGGNSLQGDQPTCATWWSDDQIIIKVPTGFAVGDQLLVQVERSDNRRSNLNPFEISTNTGPGVCDIQPTCGGDGTDVTLTGDGFGTTGDLLFGTNTVTTTSWNATEVKATVTNTEVPDRAAPYPVRVRVGGKNSNAVSFDKPCSSGSNDPCDSDPNTPQCDPDNTMCPAGEECRATNCRCYIPGSGSNDPCDSDPNTPQCDPDNAMCPAGEECRATNWRCYIPGSGSNDPCDSDPNTPQCDPDNAMCPAGEECRATNCRCYIPGSGSNDPCDSDPNTPQCDPDNAMCPAGEECRATNCRCYIPGSGSNDPCDSDPNTPQC